MFNQSQFTETVMYINTGKTPCKYGPVFALHLYRIESNRVNTVQKRVRIYTAFFLCKMVTICLTSVPSRIGIVIWFSSYTYQMDV